MRPFAKVNYVLIPLREAAASFEKRHIACDHHGFYYALCLYTLSSHVINYIYLSVRLRTSRVIKRGACIDPKGYDAGKKVSGKKRHILVDTQGLLMHAVVHPADVQDRDGGSLVIASLHGLFPFVTKLFADGGYQGPQFRKALAQVMPQLSIEIVRRSDAAQGFKVLPRRWVVERTLAWLNCCRRLAKDSKT